MENPLKRKRKELGLSVEEMSELIGINPKTIQSYESSFRNPLIKDALKVARLYGLTKDEIIEWLEYIEYKSYKKKE